MRKGVWSVILLATFCIMSAIASSPRREETREALRKLRERAEAGDAKALYDLAYLYDTGYDTIPVDSALSSALYRASAEKGYAPARNYLGFRYYNGEGGLRRDIDSALFWIERAAESGDAKGAANLGWLLAEGKDVVRDYAHARYWLAKAAEAGLPSGQSQLADLYRQGLGGAADTVMAAKLYTEAIDGGFPEAALPLKDMMLEKWKALPRDSAMAIGKSYYRRAPGIGTAIFQALADADDAEAQALMGDAYSRAQGVGYDYEKSLLYFLKAALGGNHPAQFVIGELLDIFPDVLSEPQATELLRQYGEDINDCQSSSFWYGKAAMGGVTNAESASRLLLDNISPENAGSSESWR